MWFVGFTRSLVAGLWVGYDQPRSLGTHETAGRLAGPVWADFMRHALRGTRPEAIPIPEDVLAARVNYRTGLSTDDSDPEAITEYFIRGDMSPPFSVPVAAPATRTTPIQSGTTMVPIAPLPQGAGQR